MTTDKRVNEPTPEQVEAALDALSRFNEWTENPRGAMRAALVAAAGAAPQAESECRCTYHSENRGGGYHELMLEPEPTCPEHGRDIVAPAVQQVSESDLADGELEHVVEGVINETVDMPLSTRLVLARAVVEALGTSGGEGRG